MVGVEDEGMVEVGEVAGPIMKAEEGLQAEPMEQSATLTTKEITEEGTQH